MSRNRLRVELLFIIVMIFGCIEHRKSGSIGYSETIEESKKRGVFVKRLSYKIIPDSIKMFGDNMFYIERGFRYGDFSSTSLKGNTNPLLDSDNYKYQINKSPSSGEYFKGAFLIGGGDKWRFNTIKDTIRANIVTKVPQYDSIYKVGELLLFDSNGNVPN